MQAQAALEVAPGTFKMALYTPPQLAMMAVDYVHATTGMPYWMTIVAITVGIRTAILPIGLLAARNGARTAAMKPEMDALQAAIKVTHRFCFSTPHGKRECILLCHPISRSWPQCDSICSLQRVLHMVRAPTVSGSFYRMQMRQLDAFIF